MLLSSNKLYLLRLKITGKSTVCSMKFVGRCKCESTKRNTSSNPEVFRVDLYLLTIKQVNQIHRKILDFVIVLYVCKTLVHIKMLNLASCLIEGIKCTPINIWLILVCLQNVQLNNEIAKIQPKIDAWVIAAHWRVPMPN